MKGALEMLRFRIGASAVLLSQTKQLWITGGISEDSSEFFTVDNHHLPGPKLPRIIYGHSMTEVDTNYIYIIGGNNYCGSQRDTLIIDDTNRFDMKPGPSLIDARSYHTSNKMKIEGRLFLVVVGGVSEPDASGKTYTLDTVELLDTTFPNNGWMLGKHI